MSFDLSDYITVPERIEVFRAKYPEGSLQSEIVEFLSGPDRVTVKAYAYRNDQDMRPGIGHSSLTIPGKTPYTKDSEIENAETSAWGRAIVAALAADTKRGVASANEVRKSGGAKAPGTPEGAAAVEAPTGTAAAPKPVTKEQLAKFAELVPVLAELSKKTPDEVRDAIVADFGRPFEQLTQIEAATLIRKMNTWKKNLTGQGST